MPPWLPDHVALGLANGHGNSGWIAGTNAPIDWRYQYLAGGVNTGWGWQIWQWDLDPRGSGVFVLDYAAESDGVGVATVYTYYMLLQSTPGCGGCGEADLDRANLANPTTMAAYYADFEVLLTRAQEHLDGGGNPIVVHVEPDLWGYIHQAVAATDDAAGVPAAVASSGHWVGAGLPDTAPGFAQALVRMRDTVAPDVKLAVHVSHWSAGPDVGTDTRADIGLPTVIADTVAFHASLGAAWDLVFFDPSDRDAGYYQNVVGDGGAHWWDATDATEPSFGRYHAYVAGVTAGIGLPAMLWQVPMGNGVYLTCDDTWGHYQDNRVETWFGATNRLTELRDAGVVGVLYGGGAVGCTSVEDALADGITNPPELNGNAAVSTVADDDGGYFRDRAQAYLANPTPICP